MRQLFATIKRYSDGEMYDDDRALGMRRGREPTDGSLMWQPWKDDTLMRLGVPPDPEPEVDEGHVRGKKKK